MMTQLVLRGTARATPAEAQLTAAREALATALIDGLNADIRGLGEPHSGRDARLLEVIKPLVIPASRLCVDILSIAESEGRRRFNHWQVPRKVFWDDTDYVGLTMQVGLGSELHADYMVADEHNFHNNTLWELRMRVSVGSLRDRSSLPPTRSQDILVVKNGALMVDGKK